MRLHRFYVPDNLREGNDIRIDAPELLHQWIRVFRFASSDRIILFNGNGTDFEGYFKILSKKEAVIRLDTKRKTENVSSCELHIFQSIIKKDHFEFVVEKCTEIGAAAFHPIISERSEKKDLNLARLEKIAIEATEQSGRGTVPEIFTPENLHTALETFDGHMFVCDFAREKTNIQKVKAKKIAIFIGPEGGWTEHERDLFEHNRIASISFGPHVLRAETASIVASALFLLK